MDLYKLSVGGALERFRGGSVRVGHQVISNPPEHMVRAAGWKPLAIGDIPDYDPDTQQLAPHYMDGGEAITVTYTVEPRPEEPEPPAPETTAEERIAALEAQNELLVECLLEMSGIVYGE